MPPEPWYLTHRVWGLLWVFIGLMFAWPACELLIHYYHTGYIPVSHRVGGPKTVGQALVFCIGWVFGGVWLAAHGLTSLVTGRKVE